MSRLEGRVPPLVAAGLAALAMWVLARTLPLADMSLGPARWIAGSVAATGALIAAAGIVRFRRARTTVDPRVPEQASEVVTEGIYRFTRNPMYLGFVVLLAAWGIRLENAVSLAVPLLFALYLDRFQIRFEERAMRKRFGTAFAAYAARTRRWI